jgi:hypothetical protein
MRIDNKNPIAGTVAAGVRRGASGKGFSLGESENTVRPSSASSASPLGSVDALLALQEEDTPRERKRRTLKRGHSLLDELDTLKAKMLGGMLQPHDLTRLLSLLKQRADMSGQPELDEVMRHIELRAHVEMAKLGQSTLL